MSRGGVGSWDHPGPPGGAGSLPGCRRGFLPARGPRPGKAHVTRGLRHRDTRLSHAAWPARPAAPAPQPADAPRPGDPATGKPGHGPHLLWPGSPSFNAREGTPARHSARRRSCHAGSSTGPRRSELLSHARRRAAHHSELRHIPPTYRYLSRAAASHKDQSRANGDADSDSEEHALLRGSHA